MQYLRLAAGERLATLARWMLIAATPPVLVVSLSDLPDSLGTLNLLGLLLLAQGYFHGRIASLRRPCEAEPRAAGPFFIDQAFDRDVLVVAASAAIVMVAYAYLLGLLFSLR